MTFEELVNVNSQLKTTPVKGKNYIDVAQRIQGFRNCEIRRRNVCYESNCQE